MKKLKLLIIPLLIAMLLIFGMSSFASLHSKWSSGDLIYYDGTTNIFAIKNGTDGLFVYDDIKLTFGDDSDATIEYDEAGTDKFIFTCSNGFTFAGDWGFTGDVLMATTSKIQFHDTGLYINASGNGAMVISSDGTLAVGATTSYTLTSPAVKFVATTSVVHEYDAASYITTTVSDAGAVKVAVTGDSAGAYEIETDDGAIVLDANAGITLDSGTGDVAILDDDILILGTTTINAATNITLEFDETTAGIGFLKIGDLSNSQVLNTDPGALVVPFSLVVTHSAGAGDCDDYVGIYTKFTISGATGDTGLTAVPLAARLYVDAPISQAYAFQNKAWKQSVDDVTAMAVSSVSLTIENAFEATQTLNVAEFFLASDTTRAVTCTSENFNMVLIKNSADVSGLNSLLKLVSAGSDNPANIIHVEGATDDGFLQFDSGSDCSADTDATGANATHKIKCNFNGTTFYIAGFADF